MGDAARRTDVDLAAETTSHDVRRAETADWALDARERRLEAARERARARREEQA